MALDLTDFEALSFDCYGTLIDWEAGIAAVLRPVGATPTASRSTDEDAPGGLLRRTSPRPRRSFPPTCYPRDPGAVVPRTGAELGVPVSDADADALAAPCRTGRRSRTRPRRSSD